MASLINSWLNSGEYVTDISDIRTEILKKSSQSNSEATTASIFELNLYYLIKLRTGINIYFTKEQTVHGIHHKFGSTYSRQTNSGRLDSVVNSLIIEYKHHSKLNNLENINKAFNQVIEYLEAIFNNSGLKCSAILTDGLRISYFEFLDDKVRFTNLSALTEKDIDVIIKAILNNNTKRFVPQNILNDFSVNYLVPSLSKTVACILFNSLKDKKTIKTEMLFEEWRNLMHLSVDDNGKGNDIQKRRRDLSLIFQYEISSPIKEYYALYALQTTYAIIVKLIACKVIDKLEYNGNTRNYKDLTNATSSDMQKFFEKMEDGYSYKNNNISNFLEGDFFSWYSDKEQWSTEFWKAIVNVIKCLDNYSSFSLNVHYNPIDIFKDLYMSIIPKSIRHSMGEYFTPVWLADYVNDRAINMTGVKEWKAIDPCCGSGIFLISLIKKIVGDRNINSMSYEEKEDLKKKIVNRVYGIDINPLSVLSARVGYYMALQPFGEMKNIEIPVFLGDSAILASKLFVDKIECYKYSVTNSKKPFDVILPVRFVKQNNFIKIMSQLQACVKTDNSDILFNVLLNEMNEEEKKSRKLIDKIKRLSISLTDLHKNNWDGIWVRIVTNFMLIARLSEFDIIVGNPPWVKWEHLPAVYASKIKELCEIKHIFSGAGQYGGTQLNICALISNVTATNWLSNDGVLAFLMPDSIMSQNSYEGFRNFWIDFEKKERLYLQAIDRWMPPLRPFRCENKAVTQDFNTYYFSRKNKDYSLGIKVLEITKEKNISDDLINSSVSFESAKKYLLFSNSIAKQLSNKTTAFSYTSNKYDYSKIIGETSYKYRTGVEFTPQEIFMLVGKGLSNNNEMYRFTNKKFQLSKYNVNDTPNDGWEFKTKNIYPIITGPHISEFSYDTCNEFCILPYKKENTDSPISIQEMTKNDLELLTYLANHKDLIDLQSEKSKQMHRGEEFYSLSKIGPYTFAKYIVAARDNSKFCAALIENSLTPWGEIKNTICVKHTIIISQRKTGEFIGKDEGYFICGILNSNVVQDFIHSSFKSNGYSLNKANIYIPLYDSYNDIHKKIASLAKKASTKVDSNLIKIKKQITELYLLLCESK